MFVKVTNGKPSKYPYTLGELRRDNPGTSFPKTLSNELLINYGVYLVKQTDPPVVDSKTHKVTQQVELIDSNWTQTWQIQALPEETASKNVRAERNLRLADCDWTQLTDSPFDQDGKLAWQLYRESLRMVPEQSGFPWNVDWPVKPT